MTYNQIEQWQKISDYWYMMRNLSDEKKQQEINFVKYGWQPWVNSLWYYISREFNEKLGDEVKVYEHIDLFTGETFETNDTRGKPSIYIHTWITAMDFSWKIKCSIQGLRFPDFQTERHEYIIPPGNMELTRDNIVKFTINYIQKKYLYPEGVFRTIQEYGYSKEKVKETYREMITNPRPLQSYEDGEILDWIKRKYNIDCSGFDVDQAVSIVKTYGKQNKLMVAAKFDYSFMWNFDGDIDEAEQLFYEEVESNYEPNTLFVN